MCNSNILIKIIENNGKNIIENKDYLTELDRVIGDADHGINMSKGFSAVDAKLDEWMERIRGVS